MENGAAFRDELVEGGVQGILRVLLAWRVLREDALQAGVGVLARLLFPREQ